MIFKMLYKALILKVFPSSIVNQCQTTETYYFPLICYSLYIIERMGHRHTAVYSVYTAVET